MTVEATDIEALLGEIRACTRCQDTLPMGARPVLRLGYGAPVLVAGQAPGIRVHRSGIPWDDPSGERLRQWLGVDAPTFYDTSCFAIVPMGFCYPGTIKGRGDLPPRPECRATWHDRIMAALHPVPLTLCIGQYAIDYHLGADQGRTLTDTVADWRRHMAKGFLPLPHPSPRNNLWLKRNSWFEVEVVPVLQARVASLIQDGEEMDHDQSG